jgi:hypothetical protein
MAGIGRCLLENWEQFTDLFMGIAQISKIRITDFARIDGFHGWEIQSTDL